MICLSVISISIIELGLRIPDEMDSEIIIFFLKEIIVCIVTIKRKKSKIHKK